MNKPVGGGQGLGQLPEAGHAKPFGKVAVRLAVPRGFGGVEDSAPLRRGGAHRKFHAALGGKIPPLAHQMAVILRRAIKFRRKPRAVVVEKNRLQRMPATQNRARKMQRAVAGLGTVRRARNHDGEIHFSMIAPRRPRLRYDESVIAANLLLALCLAVAPPVAADEFGLPDLGSPSSGVLSEVEERNIGREFMRAARGSLSYVDDLEINDYVNRLGRKLVKESAMPGKTFYFYVVRDPTLNAFAVPGGHVTVHTGLVEETATESELAGVLAHEIAHITQHHLARLIESGKGQTAVSIAAIMGAVLLGGAAGASAFLGANAGVLQQRLRYRRDFEKEADARGIRILFQAGYDPLGMSSFFERLHKRNRLEGEQLPEYLRTHPLTLKRVAEARVRAGDYPKIKVESSGEFFRVKARIAALYRRQPERTAEQFKLRLGEERNPKRSAALRYGYALTLNALGRFDEAAREADALLAADAGEAAFYNLRGEVEIQRGDNRQALDFFERGLNRSRNKELLRLQLASALVRTGNAARAEKLLRAEAAARPDAVELQRIYSRAAGRSGRLAASFQALGEFHYHTFAYNKSLAAFHEALKHAADDYYLASVIKARIEGIEKELGLPDKKKN